ncbi:MAG TPA: 50S ribosomal protein L20 [Candidatus Portnoybacteria bacterium]|uniref:Large ribosomal subunit protein bL20 n=1 Tax=Candidatus Portnoybacteria bacterium CG02_land_8_20_14_3_00_45_8 TaxID=1974807 RepID=A0A2M7D5T8_9BACT|nr:MAG: 50S ribosomal protein L20 [Candidatus Portnoybacteria bacterium CG02_land_8_20_14_3_00_45_8]HCX27686.1 50S ribosomal protein L20 [Candidatus Portnoybacteria bacterium]
MPRVKRAVGAHKKKKKVLKMAKGYMWSRKNRYTLAKDAVRHALKHAYVDRRKKKRDFRRIWNAQINAATRELGVTYSRFIAGLKKNKVDLDRKALAELAANHPTVFSEIVELAKK